MKNKNYYISKIRETGTSLLAFSVFVSAAGFALILAQGNTITEEGIRAIGVIKLNVNPDTNLKAYLDGKRTTITNNQTLENIIPGKYTLRIERSDYNTWEQEVEVNAGLVTNITAQLFPNKLNFTQFDSKPISELSYSHDNSKVFYIVTESQLGSNLGIWQQDLVTPTFNLTQTDSLIKISNLTSLISDAAKNKTLKIAISPNNNKLLLNTGKKIYILNTGTYNEPSTRNEFNVPYPIDQISWLKDSEHLLITSGKTLISYNLQDNSSTVVTYAKNSNSPIFTANNGVVQFIEDSLLKQYDGNAITKSELVNITLPKNITAIYSAKVDPTNLIIQSNSSLLFLNTKYSYLKSLGEYTLLSTSPHGRSLIVKDTRNNVYSISVTISQLLDKVNVDIKKVSFTGSIDGKDIVWASDSSYFVFTSDDSPQVLYSAGQQANNIKELLEEVQIVPSSYGILSTNNSLYTLVENDQGQKHLYELEFEVE